MPILAQWVTVAALLAGVTGGIVGLVIGLFDYPPTAPVAAVEIGFPAIFAGGLVGLVVGTIMTTTFRIRRHVAVRSRIKHF